MGIRKGLPAKLALTDADDTRYDFKNLVVSNADGSPRGGLIAPVGANLITGTATMDVSIGAFAAAAVRDGGVILLSSDGAQAVTIGAAPASNQRTDIVYAKQNDASTTVSSPDANNTPVLGVAVGAAGPSGGTPAAIPAGSVEVGRIVLSAGNTNTNAAVITQAKAYTANAGGSVPAATKADLDLWTTAQPGQQAYVFADPTAALIRAYIYDGSAWSFLTPIRAAGRSGVAFANQNVVSVPVVFPANRFTVAPIVTASLQAASSGSQKLVARASAVTKDGFTLVLYTGDLTLTTVSAANNPVGWEAVQMTPTIANG